jgi:acetyl esterase/lipase
MTSYGVDAILVFMKDTTTVIEGVVYASPDGVDLMLDYALPARSADANGAARPIVLYMHGGGWMAGSRDGEGERILMRRLAANGFVAVSASYRFSDVAVFPAQIRDIWAAVRWLRANADELGADPGRVGVWGHSAGGHLAALVGLTAGHEEFGADDMPVQAIIPLAAPAMISRLQDADALESHLTSLLGSTVADAPDLADRASPLMYAQRAYAGGAGSQVAQRFLIIHGDQDELVPLSQAQALHLALPGSSLFVMGGADHSFTTGSAGWPEVVALATSFFYTRLCR